MSQNKINACIDTFLQLEWTLTNHLLQNGLLNYLSRLGFSVSSDEVKLFKEWAAAEKEDAVEMHEHKFT